MPQNTDLLQEIKKLRTELARQKADLETLARQTADLAFLNALNAAANRGDSLADILALLRERTRDLFSDFEATIHLIDETGTRLLVQNPNISPKLRRAIEKLLGAPIPPLHINLTENSHYLRALRHGKTVVLIGDDILQLEHEFAASNIPQAPKALVRQILKLTHKVLNLRSVMMAPLINEGTPIGVIDISSRGEFTADDAQRFDALAAQITGIIARKQANAALRRSESLYHSLVETIPQNIFRKDREGRFTFVNANYCRMEGKSPKEILGKTDFDLYPPDLAEKYRRDDAFVMSTGKMLELIEKHQPIGGNVRYVRVVKTPLYDGDTVIGIQGIFEDITLQKENEERLEQYSRRLQLLHKIDRGILAADTSLDIAHAVLEPLLRIIDAKRASVVLFDEGNHTGTILATAGEINPQGLQAGDTFPLQEYPVYQTYRQSPDNIVQIFPSLSGSKVERSLKKQSIDAALNIILLFGNEPVGAINFGFYSADDILPEYREIAREAADSLAVALKQAHQTEKIRQDAATKTRLLQEIDHRVRNNLTTISSIVYLEMRQTKPDDAFIPKAALEALNVRIRSLTALHEMLADRMWNLVPLRELATRVFSTVCRAIDTGNNEIIIDVSPTEIMLPPTTAQNIAFLFTEIILDTITFALPEHNRLVFHATTTEDETHITLTFRVDNAAFPDEFLVDPPKSTGMTLLNITITQSLHGEWHMENDAGSAVIVVRFPRKLVSPAP